MENKQNFSVEITLSVTNLMKLMDLSGKLGLVLGTNPIWKNGYVTFSDEFDEFYTQMSLDLDNGRWLIATGECGVLNLPQEAIALMGKMSKLAEGKE